MVTSLRLEPCLNPEGGAIGVGDRSVTRGVPAPRTRKCPIKAHQSRRVLGPKYKKKVLTKSGKKY